VPDGAVAGDRLRVKSDTMFVGSLPVFDADPPPDTLTEFVMVPIALAVTFTVTVIGG
jgi:hypothetical protein